MAINRTKLAKAHLEGKELADCAKAAGSKAKTRHALQQNAYRALNDAEGRAELERLRSEARSQAVASVQECMEGLTRIGIAAEAEGDHAGARGAYDTLLKAHGAYVQKTEDVSQIRAQLLELRTKMSPEAFRELLQALQKRGQPAEERTEH